MAETVRTSAVYCSRCAARVTFTMAAGEPWQTNAVVALRHHLAQRHPRWYRRHRRGCAA